MFEIDPDKTIHATRGDAIAFMVSAVLDTGEKHIFQPGEIVRLTITERKNCGAVMVQKEFAATAGEMDVPIELTGDEMKFGAIISKPVDYWYEVEMNPENDPKTIIGYDKEGPKVLRLYPEGGEKK